MDAPPPRPRKPRRRWRWHVPPALAHAGESLEGVQVLEEVPTPLGLLLWETYRDVVLWSGTAPEERAGLFDAGAHAARLAGLDGAGVPAELAPALRAAAVVLARPAQAEEEAVRDACGAAADWAERSGLLATAAAVAAPAHPGAALRAGSLARRHAENARAETWYRRTIGLGRQAKDWTSYSNAFIGLGNLYRQRGNRPVARRFYIRALRAARRHALRESQACALHGLFTLASDTDWGEAQELARSAIRAYGPRHARLHIMAHDVGVFWMEHGRFAPAL